MIRIRITSADIAMFLSCLNAAAIPIYDIRKLNDFSAEFSVYRQNLRKILKIAEKHNNSVTLLKEQGLFWMLKGIIHRPVICVMIFLLLIGGWLLPGRIFFVEVEGNSRIPAELILQRAQECGIQFGASRHDVRSERMKNALLEAIPELKWAGVNTAGCVATISVTERSEPVTGESKKGVASIVALYDGIITDLTVTKGTALRDVGQAVKQGETIVSGYTDCGFKIQASTAEAEVYALTKRIIEIVRPCDYGLKGDAFKTQKNYSIKIGKNKIKISRDSGILPHGCDKMYTEHYLTLPGGFLLPVALVVEEYIFYEESAQSTLMTDVETELRNYAAKYLSGNLLSGTILLSDVSVVQKNDCYIFTGEYTCREQIGMVQNEEIILNYGENN